MRRFKAAMSNPLPLGSGLKRHPIVSKAVFLQSSPPEIMGGVLCPPPDRIRYMLYAESVRLSLTRAKYCFQMAPVLPDMLFDTILQYLLGPQGGCVVRGLISPYHCILIQFAWAVLLSILFPFLTYVLNLFTYLSHDTIHLPGGLSVRF